MKDNWLSMPRSSSVNTDAIRKYVAGCSNWPACRMNDASVGLLLICSSIDCFGTLWENLFCMSLGSLETLTGMIVSACMVALAVPLLLDVSFVLMQRVHPVELVTLMRHEIASI